MTARNLLFFDRFHNRYRLSASYVTRTGLRVGAGRSDALEGTDLPLLRLGRDNDLLVIPGSTWKGVVRSASEAILRSATPEGRDWRRMACDPFGVKPTGDNADVAGRCLGDFELKNDRISAEEKVRKERDFVEANICRACALFGAEGLASRVRFADSVLGEDAHTRIRDGVGLSRDLGRAEDGIKYDYEIIEPTANVNLTIDVDNALDWQIGLLLAVLEEIGRGSLRIGGGGSRGLGWLELQGEVRVEHYPSIHYALGRKPAIHLDAAQVGALGAALDSFLEDPFASEAPCTA